MNKFKNSLVGAKVNVNLPFIRPSLIALAASTAWSPISQAQSLCGPGEFGADGSSICQLASPGFFVAMVGAYFLCIRVLGMDEAIFWDKTSLWLNPNHINEGLIKAAVFGWVFSLICTYRGFQTKGGARGVGDSTNRGVVLSMVMIIILDFFLMNIIDIYYKVTA